MRQRRGLARSALGHHRVADLTVCLGWRFASFWGKTAGQAASPRAEPFARGAA